MPYEVGARLGPYEILNPLGVGGMGEVYRARDTKLGRDVALKFIKDVFAHDEHRVRRFEREAQVLATLNHPNIAAIYGILDTESGPALVLEFVDGPTLADRIAKGSIPLDEALVLGRQIAEALEAAHELDIVHRDLKPGNIKLRADGTVKVLDFGLARLIEAERAQASLTPASSGAATQEGLIIGTAAYMSPEQARGRPVDRRSDLWSLGCVLYEMLTGRQAFETGETISDSVATILKSDLNWNALPADTPESIRRLLRRCLNKDRNYRLQSAGDARVELDEARTAPPETPKAAAAHSASPRGERIAWIAATAVLAATALVFAVSYFRPPPAAPPEIRADIVTPATPDLMSFAISPDGRRVVFSAAGDGQTRLWLRTLEAATAQPLAGTEGASFPFWSPDSRSIAFFAIGKLKRLDIGAGLPQTLTDAPLGQGGTWNQQDVILFSRARISPLFRVPATGGEAVQATTFLATQTGHRFPQFLPDGKRFLLYAAGQADAQGIFVGTLDGGTLSRLTGADSAAAYADGWLMFNRGGALIARRFDPAGTTLAGDPITIAESITFDSASGVRGFSMSAAGPIVYRSGATSRRQLGWFDRSGKSLGVLGAPDDSGLIAPVISPDGRRAAATRAVQGNTDVWLVDEARTTRFTVDPSPDQFPVWSPSGDRIVFRSNRSGTPDLYVKASNGAGETTPIFSSPQTKTATDWSRDGRFILYGVSDDPKTGYDVWVLPLEGDGKPFPFVNTASEERNAVFSPDGHWVAYQANESGRHEVYVRPFPTPAGGQWQVSSGGGIAPRWSPDGKELYYLAPDAKLMAAPIVVKGTVLEAGVPSALFQTRAFGGGTDAYQRVQYDVARDGRFLINMAVDDTLASPITLLLNWKPRN